MIHVDHEIDPMDREEVLIWPGDRQLFIFVILRLNCINVYYLYNELVEIKWFLIVIILLQNKLNVSIDVFFERKIRIKQFHCFRSSYRSNQIQRKSYLTDDRQLPVFIKSTLIFIKRTKWR